MSQGLSWHTLGDSETIANTWCDTLDGRTPLHLAARRGNLKAAARLDGEGKTPQHVAAEAGACVFVVARLRAV
ncbi:hypothetical protein EMIHUDRAFT_236548 [Emiliania huxleyi CCMP1516]|uniref:Ankyrin repeat protein n=2 Tax=Emiliania huxleyi TaxID=2903 RepID=A0A0D3JTB0_EMIH1|nr:hypothetical protein EMIHUDRAFT_236548 [Emiliania huxleyi CCMP1516]EOD26745.1 hypothetical protein EMIHUDRAFT_236548 [Emiliania huxleyi CCMP1516]|eukprot:XP_005779174.1 hypothetical protein EMIHUDRAFT_236548 [Emiliania huxleyi CCMP1516]